MKGGILFLFALIVLVCSFQKKKRDPLPPGTVRINDTLFVDKTEMTNIGWREYLHYLLDEKKDTNAYFQALPDTTVWRDDFPSDPLAEYYFRHPAFNSYPLAGVAYEQAVAYCEWRTYIANQGLYFREKKIKNFREHLNDTFPIRFWYRLPSSAEWEKIAAGKYDPARSPYGYPDIYFKWRGKTHMAFNCKYAAPTTETDRSGTFYTSETKSYYPNSSGAYCMIGNLAEMVAEKGIAKGGSFLHLVDSSRIDANQHYDKPERWLGFRCVAVLSR